MNWDAIGAIAELLGAIGVILTLIYLAIQIRQNTRSQENSSRLVSTHAFTGWYTTVMTDPELIRVWRVGHTQPDELSEDDINRFMWMLSSIGSRIEEAFTQYEAGLLDEPLWHEYRDLMASFLHNSIAKYWWDQGISPFSSRFRGEIEAAVQDKPSWDISGPSGDDDSHPLSLSGDSRSES